MRPVHVAELSRCRASPLRAMASFSGLAGKVRSITESDEFDLGSISSAYDAGRLITDAFSTPFSDRDEMVRVTLVVGAGKANRQKYDASLQKWIVAALKAIDYEDNKSASCDFDSAGSFKTQHDTGRNLIFVHVFPRCSQKKAVAHDDDEATTVDEPARLSREHLLVAAEMKTFERTVAKRCPTWSCKKRLQEKLREVRAQFTTIDAKLMNREALDDAEQALYELGSGDDLDGKLKFLQKSLMEMVQNGQLTTAEKTLCLEQMDERAEAAPNDKARKRIEENREALSKRSVLDYRPPKSNTRRRSRRCKQNSRRSPLSRSAAERSYPLQCGNQPVCRVQARRGARPRGAHRDVAWRTA